MVFTVPAGFLTASSSGPVRGFAVGLEAVDSLAGAILMADGTLTDIVTLTVGVDSAAEDLTIADAAWAVADRLEMGSAAPIQAADPTVIRHALAASTVVVADSTAEEADAAVAVMVGADTGKL
jgi:hypothetical protein